MPSRYTFTKYKDCDGIFSVIKHEKDVCLPNGMTEQSVYESELSEKEADKMITDLQNDSRKNN